MLRYPQTCEIEDKWVSGRYGVRRVFKSYRDTGAFLRSNVRYAKLVLSKGTKDAFVNKGEGVCGWQQGHNWSKIEGLVAANGSYIGIIQANRCLFRVR